jgi:hypothetical protein
MPDKSLLKSPPDWVELIRKTFIAAWAERTAVDITAYLYHIEAHFYLEKIAEQLTQKPEQQRSFLKRIKVMTGALCEALLDYSDDGKTLTDRHIMQAKEKMLRAEPCEDIEL